MGFVRADDPQTIPDASSRQIFQALAVNGKITQDEALAFVRTGTLPTRLAELVDMLPSDDRFAAQMVIIGGDKFQRHHPLSEQIVALYGMQPAEADELWRQAAAL